MARIIHRCISVPNISKSLTTVPKIPLRTKIRLKDITWWYLNIFRVCSPPFLLNDWEEPQQSHQGSPLVPKSGQTVQDSVPVDAGFPVLEKTSERGAPRQSFLQHHFSCCFMGFPRAWAASFQLQFNLVAPSRGQGPGEQIQPSSLQAVSSLQWCF